MAQSLNYIDGYEALNIIRSYPDELRGLMSVLWENEMKVFELRIWTIVINDLFSKGQIGNENDIISFGETHQYNQNAFSVTFINENPDKKNVGWSLNKHSARIDKKKNRIYFNYTGETSDMTYYLHYHSLYIDGYFDINSLEFHYKSLKISRESLK
jgi:hypothetical protein